METLSTTKFGPTGKTIFDRTYSRTRPDGEKETWDQTCLRVVEGNLALVYGKFRDGWSREVIDEADKLYYYMREMAILPAGRHLWATGVEGRQHLFNCHVAGWGEKLSEHFDFSFMRLMEGGGVGANYSTKYIKKFGAPRRLVQVHVVCDPAHPDYEELRPYLSRDMQPSTGWDYSGAEPRKTDDFLAGPDTDLEVKDSREGWAEALVSLIDTAMASAPATNLVFDVGGVRQSGSKLKTFGGTASGPAPFARMMHEVSGVLNSSRQRGELTPIGAMEIDHAIAECVVSGGNRRSARMSIVRWDDPYIYEFLRCKQDTGKHWTTNISVEIDDQFINDLSRGYFKDRCAAFIHKAVCTEALTNGEPGYWNSSLSNTGELEPVICTNPCGEIPLTAWENCFDGDTEIITRDGVKTLRELAGKKTDIWFDGGWYAAEGRSFGTQRTQTVAFAPARQSTGSGYQRTRAAYRREVIVTPDHRWDTQRGLVSDLRVGDVVWSGAASVESDFAGIKHGIIFGDGSEHSPGKFRVRLYGAKQDYLYLFDHVTYPEKAGVPEGWHVSPVRLKELPAEGTSPEYKAGFLEGWLAMDGTVRPNGSVALSTTREDAVAWLEKHAASLGWTVRGHFTHDAPTNYGERNAPLHIVTLAKDGEWTVTEIRAADSREVFCVTVPGAGRFTLASGIQTRNCNLGHVNMDWFAGRTPEHMEEAHRLITRFLMRATFGDVNDPRQAEKLSKQRRIGVGHLGVQGYWAKEGVRYSEIPQFAPIRLNNLYRIVRSEARAYAFKLRIPEPVKVTTVAPTGSVAKLPGVSEGIHPIYARWYERRVRFSKRDEAQMSTILDAMAQGFKVEDDMYDSSGMTAVVVYPTEDILLSEVKKFGWPEDIVESAEELTISQMLDVQKCYQDHWADNAVSYTVNIPENSVWPHELQKVLGDYLPSLKGTTIMVDSSRPQAPYTRITKAEYEAAEAKRVEDSTDLECASGACPIR